MSHINKSKFRRPGAQSKRRKVVECDESKMEQEHQLSAGPRAESAATIGPAIEEPSALKNNASLSPGDNHQRGVRTMEDKEKAAEQALKFQAKATEWSKNTMFAPVFEMQNSIARSCVEISTKAARRFWQLE